MRGPLLRELEGLKSLPARKRLVSSVTGAFVDHDTLGPEHWWQNVREPVKFEAGLSCLLKEGLRVFVEIGPKPILSNYVRDMLREANVRGSVVETLAESQDHDALDPIERAVSRLLLAGARVDPHRFFGSPPVAAIPLPPYPWRHIQFKITPTAEATTVFAPPSHPLLGSRPRADCSEWFSTIDPTLFPWIADHKVGGISVFPAAGYVEVMLAAAREVYPDGANAMLALDIFRPLIFDGSTSLDTSLRLARESGIADFLSRRRGAGLD